MGVCKYLPFTITLTAPAIFNVPGEGDLNSARTLSYIPGTAIRGVVAGRLPNPNNSTEHLREFRTLILSDQVCYLNAYPCYNQRRFLPAPVSLRVEKGTQDGGPVEVFDLSAYSGAIEEDEGAWPDEELSGFPYPYLSLTAAQPQGLRPSISARMHHQRDRQRGRAWKDERGTTHGSVFSYEYLDQGQTLAGLMKAVGATEEECMERLERVKEVLLKDQLLLGRSRRAGYGGNASVSFGEPMAREVVGADVINADIQGGTVFRVLLTSPCIVRALDSGQLDPGAFESELERKLGGRAALVRKRWDFDICGGFNRKWRTEVLQAPAVAAGSVFVLKATDPIAFSDVLQIENEGIGERQAEGFGRIVFLSEPYRKFVVRPIGVTAPKRPNGKPPELIRFLEKRLLGRAVTRRIHEKAARLSGNATRIPTAALLGRLRVPLRDKVGLDTMHIWLGDSDNKAKLRRPAIEKISKCVLGDGTRLSAFLRKYCDENQEALWGALQDVLDLRTVAQRNHVISEQSATAELKAMARSIAVRFLDAVLEGLSRSKRREVGQDA